MKFFFFHMHLMQAQYFDISTKYKIYFDNKHRMLLNLYLQNSFI